MIFFRAIRIITIGIKRRVDRHLIGKIPIFWMVFLSPLKLIVRKENLSISTRKAIEELGPIFIKLGQILSTRKDLFTEEMLTELEKLQDNVPPFKTKIAKDIIENELGSPIKNLFASFESTPLASASVAQIHRAELIKEDGSIRTVAVKVIRPNIEVIIRKDIRLMKWLARLIEKISPDTKRLHLSQIIEDYENNILDELDLTIEANNTIKLKQNWELSGKLYVPEIEEQLLSRNVMVMEYINGLPVTSIEDFKTHGVDLRKLAHLGVEIFFTQVFDHNFFHADMHPGNVFVDISNPENPTYIALDCAVIGSLTEKDQLYLAKNIYAFFQRDYEEVTRLHHESGWIPKKTNLREFANVIRSVMDPYFKKPISEISLSAILLKLFNMAKKYEVDIQPQLVLLQKNLVNIEGMGRQIYPELNLWESAAPFMENWVKKRIGIKGVARRVQRKIPVWLEIFPELPELLFTAQQELREIKEQHHKQTELIEQIQLGLRRNQRSRTLQVLAFGCLVIFGALYWMYIPH